MGILVTAPRSKATMKAVDILMLALATLVQAAPEDREKRFLLKEINDVIHHVSDSLTHVVNSAKDAVSKVASGLDFDKAVGSLKGMIHSGMTVTVCTTTCKASAATVLGPFAMLSGSVCTPLCDAALAELEHASG